MLRVLLGGRYRLHWIRILLWGIHSCILGIRSILGICCILGVHSILLTWICRRTSVVLVITNLSSLDILHWRIFHTIPLHKILIYLCEQLRVDWRNIHMVNVVLLTLICWVVLIWIHSVLRGLLLCIIKRLTCHEVLHVCVRRVVVVFIVS